MKSLVILVLLFGVNNVLGRPNSIMFPTDPPEELSLYSNNTVKSSPDSKIIIDEP